MSGLTPRVSALPLGSHLPPLGGTEVLRGAVTRVVVSKQGDLSLQTSGMASLLLFSLNLLTLCLSVSHSFYLYIFSVSVSFPIFFVYIFPSPLSLSLTPSFFFLAPVLYISGFFLLLLSCFLSELCWFEDWCVASHTFDLMAHVH